MLDIKKVLAKLLHITEPTTLTRPISGRQTTAWNWTAPYNGILYLSGITYQRHYFGIMWNGANIGDFAVGGNNQGSSAFTLTFILKKGDTISTSALNTNCYLEGTRTCFIKLGGVLLNCIFKAFSHLQKIGGGLNAGYQKANSKDIKEHKNAFNCAFCYGICGSKERKRLYNRTDSKWLHIFNVVCDKDRRLGWRGLQFNSQCSNGKSLDSAKQHRNRKWKCDLLRLIHKERLGVIASERRCYYA